jgi:hypothetical protein
MLSLEQAEEVVDVFHRHNRRDFGPLGMEPSESAIGCSCLG